MNPSQSQLDAAMRRTALARPWHAPLQECRGEQFRFDPVADVSLGLSVNK